MPGQTSGMSGHLSLFEQRVSGKHRVDKLGAQVRRATTSPLRLYLLSGPPRWLWLDPGVVGACARSLLLPSQAASIVLRRFVEKRGCHAGGWLPKGARRRGGVCFHCSLMYNGPNVRNEANPTTIASGCACRKASLTPTHKLQLTPQSRAVAVVPCSHGDEPSAARCRGVGGNGARARLRNGRSGPPLPAPR